jgi:hypothetical protein
MQAAMSTPCCSLQNSLPDGIWLRPDFFGPSLPKGYLARTTAQTGGFDDFQKPTSVCSGSQAVNSIICAIN